MIGNENLIVALKLLKAVKGRIHAAEKEVVRKLNQ